MTEQNTVEHRKFEVLRTRGSFLIISSSNHRDIDIKVCNPQNVIVVFVFHIPPKAKVIWRWGH